MNNAIIFFGHLLIALSLYSRYIIRNGSIVKF